MKVDHGPARPEIEYHVEAVIPKWNALKFLFATLVAFALPPAPLAAQRAADVSGFYLGAALNGSSLQFDER